MKESNVHIVTFGWQDFAVHSEFDLNILKSFLEVTKTGETYVKKDDGKIRIVLNERVAVTEQEAEESKVGALKSDLEGARKWANIERSEKEKLKTELECLKKQLVEAEKSSDL